MLWSPLQKQRIVTALKRLQLNVDEQVVIVIAVDDDSEDVILEVDGIIKRVTA